MSEENSVDQSSLSQSNADTLARRLNVIFNTATLYGGDHPSTINSAKEFTQSLGEIFSTLPMVTILRMGDSLYIEKCCVDQRMNASRTITRFENVGIESISFQKGMNQDEVNVFIRVFSDNKTFATVEKMNEELQKHGVKNVLLNYVFLKTLTKDDSVVDKDTKIVSKDALIIDRKSVLEGNQGSKDTKVFEQIGKLFSLKNMVDQPEEMAQHMVASSSIGEEGGPSIINQLQGIRSKIKNMEVGDENISEDEMMESFFNLTSELKNQVSLQTEMGKLENVKAPVIDEIERITLETIIQIVRDEYKKGTISIKRLSQIIRRVLPDIKDLKKLLPMLKEALLRDGMSLSGYLQLTKELNKELQSDGLLEKLEESAEEIGLTVEDIVRAFHVNPAEAAKIIILASEIEGDTEEVQTQFSNKLSDYIESVGSKMTLDAPELNEKGGGKILGKIIHQVEGDLVNKVMEQDMPETVIQEVEKQLAERYPKTLQKLKVDFMVNKIAGEGELSNTSLTSLLSSVVNKESELDVIRKPIENALHQQGVNMDDVKKVFDEILTNLVKNKESISLLKMILSNNNTQFIIERLIKENSRYHNPFSCLSLSVKGVKKADSYEPIPEDKVLAVLNDVFATVKAMLRDLDLIGSLEKMEKNLYLIILPMTNAYGAEATKRRLLKKLSEIDFDLDDEAASLNIILNAVPFDSSQTQDFKELVEFVNKTHKQEEEKEGFS